jgi:hypothetical protein
MQAVRQFHGRHLGRNAALVLVTTLAPVAAAKAQDAAIKRIESPQR